jgi:hypothetical protein
VLINPPLLSPSFPVLLPGQARCQPRRRTKLGLGQEGGGHCSPPKTLFTGNNPHYLFPLWANQTIAKAEGCFLLSLGGNGAQRGGGLGGTGAEVAPSGLLRALVQHSFRYLTPWSPGLRFSKRTGWEELYI